MVRRHLRGDPDRLAQRPKTRSLGRFADQASARAVPKPLEESDESQDEQAGGGTYHTSAGGVRDDADHSLVGAVRSGAVRERNDGKPEQSSECNADRQSCEAHRS